MRRRGVAVALAATAGVAIGVTLALARSSGSASHEGSRLHGLIVWRHGARPAPALSLRDEAGRMLSLRSQHGRVVLLTFLDSRCRSACPLDGRRLGTLERDLRGSRAELLVVSVDPWADTARSAKAFAARAGWRGPWHWLLGSPRALRPVWRAYKIAVQRAGDIVHTRALYLIDAGGYLRTVYLEPVEPAAVAHDARAVAAA
jgi:cytochrome oxidase Cu insertion factor (SCO1/SenC/PrrC family)